MTIDLDLRDPADDRHRELIDERLNEVEAGEKLHIVADQDVDVHLLRYQLEHDRILEWEHADPDAEPRKTQVQKEGPLGNGELPSFDVRDLIPQRRHEVLLESFDRLKPDEGFVLVNDHDPKPLYHELRSMHGDVIEWTYANRGSGEWRVEIVKTGTSTGTEGDIITRYDVREIPKPERHDTIHHRYGMIPDGETMELIAPHEPRPLRQEFQAQYGDAFEWEVVENRPDRCRVQITKRKGSEPRSAASDDDDGASGTGSSTEESLEITAELDVRDRPPAERHKRIFQAYEDLGAGEGFVLVNDHDPKPLYHQFEAEAGPEFHWEYRAQDPGEFRVVIGKAETKSESGNVSSPDEQPEAPF